MSRGVLVKVAFKLVVISMCLSCITLVGACGSKSGGSPSPAPAPPTPQKQAAKYFKELAPVLKVDKALSKKTSKLTTMELKDRDDAYSVAAAIDGAFLPEIERAQEMLATIKPPPQFRVAHARLRQEWALAYDFLYFMSDSLRGAVFTQTVDPGFKAKGDRYVARARRVSREYDIAIRAGAKRSHVKVPKRLLLETSF
jgi:hypothetical protein